MDHTLHSGVIPGVLRGLNGVPEIKPGKIACKADLPVLFLQPITDL